MGTPVRGSEPSSQRPTPKQGPQGRGPEYASRRPPSPRRGRGRADALVSTGGSERKASMAHAESWKPREQVCAALPVGPSGRGGPQRTRLPPAGAAAPSCTLHGRSAWGDSGPSSFIKLVLDPARLSVRKCCLENIRITKLYK